MKEDIQMYCQECGKEIKDGSAFCPFCGTKQEREDVDYGMRRDYGNEAEYEGSPDYRGETNYERDLGYRGETEYEGGPGYRDEAEYKGSPDYEEETGYRESPSYGEETDYEQVSDSKNEFCPYCGRKMVNGRCECIGFQNSKNKGINGFLNTNGKEPFLIPSFNLNTSSFSGFMSSIRDLSGMSEASSSIDDPYEHDVPIVPDCIEPEENEIVIKQYNIAKLRTRLKFMKAEGRMMITNRRVLFRAAGTSLTGNILQEHQFNLDEVGGIEMHKDYKFSLLNLIGCILLSAFASGLIGWIIGSLARNAFYNGGGVAGIAILFSILGFAGLIPTFIVYKHFWLKLFCASISVSCFACSGSLLENVKALYVVLLIISGLILLINIVIVCFVPNLVIKIKTKSAAGAVVIGCQKAMILRKTGDDYSGFTEVLPWEDTIMAINEIGTIIDDLQKQGDYAVEKWASSEAE